MIIDAHAHLWQLERHAQPWIDPDSMAAVDRDFWVDDLRRAQLRSGIAGSIVVQATHTTRETLDLLAASDGEAILGVIGWVDLETDVAAQLSTLVAAPGGERLVGVRHLAHQDPDPDWLLRPRVQDGLAALAAANLPFDVVVQSAQLATVERAIAQHPELTFVLDHLGKPPIASGDLAEWERNVSAIAAHENVVAKLSGLGMEADWSEWTLDDLRRPVDHAVTVFGATRLMFGTDWPLVELTQGLPRWVSTAQELIDASDHETVFAATAHSTYSLGVDHG